MDDTNQTLSFKRIFMNAKDVFAYLFSKSLFIVGITVLSALAGVLYAYLSKPKYTGELNFVLSDNNSQGSLSSLASQFGFDFSGSGNDVFSQENVMVLMSSRKILSRALFRNLPDKNLSLINLYIQTEKLDEKWDKNKHLQSAYPFPKDYNQLSPLQDSLFKEMYSAINKNVFKIQQPDKKVNVFQVTTTYYNELFACYLTKYLVEEASGFYIETKTSIARQNLKMISHEADSLRTRLGNNIISTATAADQTLNLNSNYQVGRAPIQKSQADAAVTQAAYTEVIKNLEIAKITLAKAYPIYQIIDEPSLPLKKEKMGRLLGAILFGGIFCLLTAGFFVAKYYLYKQE